MNNFDTRHTSHTTAPLLKKFISSPPIVKVNPQNKGTFTVSSVSSEISYIFQRETRHTSSVWWCVLCSSCNMLRFIMDYVKPSQLSKVIGITPDGLRKQRIHREKNWGLERGNSQYL